MASRHARLLVAALGIGGCSEYSAKSGRALDSDGNSTFTSNTSSPAVDSGSSTATDFPRAAFYGLTLAFEASEGEIVDGTATVAVDLWSDSVPPVVLCRHQVPVLAAFAEDEVPALDSLETDADTGAGGLVGWWQLDLDVGVPDAACSDWPGRTLWFGLGPYDTRLDPSLDAVGLLGSDLFGLYLQEDPQADVYVLGVAGTQEMFAGGYGPDPEAPPPLPDGVYTAESLVLMSL